ncbi:hypothetical protein [Paenibacillus arenosi]|uniref:Uncharacterized protein n=1 Tax=Paenibacillus arenosi TaxID=2774142 RepID=A0ABR9AY03_9BACL|nr:hypothetical protein [Paenibacillus arenosi]MBD8498897.1 hypothetical protein [Paenibacillus arenosi]
MLDELIFKMNEQYGNSVCFMGLSFKCSRGIVMIDNYEDKNVKNGFLVVFTSYLDNELPVTVLLHNMEELRVFLEEVAF